MVVGLKSVYVDEEVIQNMGANYDFKLNKDSTVIVLQVIGRKAQEKVKKVVGNPDCQYARKMEQKSLNSVHYKRNNSIIYTKKPECGAKMGFYFFAGRLNRVTEETLENFLNDPVKVLHLNLDVGAF